MESDHKSDGGLDTAPAIAAEGTAGAGVPLPHLERIQRYFGRHNLGHIQAHLDEPAAQASRALGAEAFASGEHVAFAGAPSLHTAAHEAAHVVQQRAGVHLKGGLGESGDAHEKEADAIADRVVRGESAEPLLDKYAPGGAAPAGNVQRKVGFELEYAVPTFRAPRNGAVFHARHRRLPSNAIQRFLMGGVPYATDMGTDPQGFKLTADHGSVDRGPVRDTLQDKHLVTGAQDRDDTSNLEYVTNAIDELAPGSDRLFTPLINAVTTHMGQVHAAATSGQMQAIPAPGGAFYTGVPVADFQTWLGSKYNSWLAADINAFRGTIADQIYIQATVGIIPSAMRDLHTRALGRAQQHPTDLNSTAPENTALAGVDAEINTVLGLPAFHNHPYIVNLRQHHPISYEAFAGMMHIAFMYVVGDALYQTSNASNSTVKNAVPFLIKCFHRQVRRDAATDWIKNHRPPSDLCAVITNHLTASQYADRDWWTGSTAADYNQGLNPVARDPNKKLVRQPYAEFIAGILRGQDVQAVIGATQLRGADPSRPQVLAASEQEKGIPVEHRWILANPTRANVAAELWKVIREVRDLNLKHVPNPQRAQMLQAVQ